jgi:hypothetical protein
MTDGDPESALGYLAQVADAQTYVGGLFVVGPEGDPLDFVYTEPVGVSPLERFLLGSRADAYVLARVMLPALLTQVKVWPQVILMEDASVLLRSVGGDIPLVVLAPVASAAKNGEWERLEMEGLDGHGFWSNQRGLALRAHLERATAEMAPFTLREPFEQIRRTLGEMRRGR